MKPWKCFFGAALLCLFLLASCGEPNEVRTALNTADSLLADGQPDSAYSLLSALPQAEKEAMSTKSLMRYELLKARAQNSAYIPFTSDSVMLRVADYYDRHGNANEQMTANYVLGCAYYDMGEAPLALRYFHEACDRADTTAADCDWKTLSRVHGQMAWVFMQQEDPYDVLQEETLVRKYALKAKDSIMYISSYAIVADAYEIMNQPDSMIGLLKKTSVLFNKMGNREMAVISLVPAAEKLIVKGEIHEAEKILTDYEKESNLFDEFGNICPGREAYYYIKGQLCLAINSLDSSNYYFNKLLRTSQTTNQKEMAYRGLLDLSKRRGHLDSIAKYAQLVASFTDSTYLQKSTADFQKIQAMHKYTRQEQLAEKRRHESIQRGKMLSVTLFLVIILALIVVVGYLVVKKRRAKVLEQERTMYRKYKNLLQEKIEVDMMLHALETQKNDCRDELMNIVKRKDENIQLLQKEIKEHEERQLSYKLSIDEERLMTLPVVLKCKTSAAECRKLSVENVCELHKAINDELPHFISSLYGLCPLIREDEITMCILVRMRFRPKEIANLMSISIQQVAKMRKRLLKKIFQDSEGSSNDFDFRIMKI